MKPFWRALLLAVLIGVGLRLALVIASGWRLDYDEGMIALLGRRVLAGEWRAFVPAQPTLGAIEAYLLAPLFALFGANVVTFRALSLLLNAAYIASTGLLGRAAYGSRAGALAALLATCAPPYMLFTGMKTWGATIETLILGNLLLLCVGSALRGGDHARRWGWCAALIAGVMFWIAWLGFYYFVPALLIVLGSGVKRVIAARHPPRVRAMSFKFGIQALFLFSLGSLPFWLHNAAHGFESFATLGGAGGASAETRAAVIAHMIGDLLPRLVTGDPAWGLVSSLAQILIISLYAAGLLALLIGGLLRGAGQTSRALLAVFVVCLPAIYLFSGYGANALNPWGIDATGRYVLMLHSALPIGVAALTILPISRVGRKGGSETHPGIPRTIDVRQGFFAAAVMGFALLLCLNLSGGLRADAQRGFDSPYYDRLPQTLDPLIAYLDANGFTHVWIDTGIAHLLLFHTGERILAADYYDAQIAGGLPRFPEVLATVEAADFAVYVVPILPGQTDFPLRRAFDAAGIAYRIDYPTPTLAVFVPDRRVHPSEVAAGLGYQY